MIEMGVRDLLFDPGPARVTVTSGRKIVGAGELDADWNFEFAIPDDLEGELELAVGTSGAGPVLFEAGGDVELVVLFSRGGSNYLG